MVMSTATAVFLHGVGGSMPGWDGALGGQLEHISPQLHVGSLEVGFDDLIGRSGAIRRRPAAHRHEPVLGDSRSEARARYQRRQGRLRKAIWDSPDRVASARPIPVLIPGEVMVRLPVLGMRQAGHYRHDDHVRADVLDRVAEAINQVDGPVILLAHSLGSVVALDALHVRGVSVELLVSFGSPLGVKDFWGKTWQDPATFPYDRLGGWLNVVNVKDPIVWGRGVNERFPQAIDAFISAGRGLTGPLNFHDAATYTGAEITARAVAAATSGLGD